MLEEVEWEQPYSRGHPIAYILKTFGPRTRVLSVYERELLAITFAVTKWRQYLENDSSL